MGRPLRPILTLGVLLLAWPSPGSAQSGDSSEGGPKLTVSGVLYAQYAYALRDPDGTGHANNVDVTRAYLNVIGRFNDGVSSRVTGDVYRNGEGSLAYRLKYGYVAWTPRGSALTFKLGMYETPFVSYAEGLWGYRMQGSDPTDRAGYLSSSDLGMGVEGAWREEGVTLSAGLYNGETYKNRPGDQHKDVAARLSVRLLRSDEPGRYGGLRVTGFALLGQPTGGGRRSRLLGQVSYRSTRATLGATAMTTRDRVDSTLTAPTTDGRLVSVMGVYRIPRTRVAVIGRVDRHDPDVDAAGDRLTRFIVGVSYQLNPNLRLLGDLDHTSYQRPQPAGVEGTRSQALFQIQVVF